MAVIRYYLGDRLRDDRVKVSVADFTFVALKVSLHVLASWEHGDPVKVE
ncbi:hypothetical protein RB620_26420 [Paenibacillus sp. LHD-117]|nr:hypothetical protein [Paenibacillus sp. LHD-117]MDQ6422967.1 hypothetical protein [Paenibacillus sp. LHD-117]